MRLLLGLVLLAATGCTGFTPPTPNQLLFLSSQDPEPSSVVDRFRVQLSLDSPKLAGEFDGVVLARHGGIPPVVRLQLFGDLGPKMLDLLATPTRIVGYFPQAREGIDCELPDEASPHFLTFLGGTLVEHFAERPGSRVVGVRTDPDGLWLRLRPVIPGLTVDALREPSGRISKRRFSWMYGVSWHEEWPSPEEMRLSASGLTLRVKILERTSGIVPKKGALELTLPEDVRVVEGRRR